MEGWYILLDKCSIGRCAINSTPIMEDLTLYVAVYHNGRRRLLAHSVSH